MSPETQQPSKSISRLTEIVALALIGLAIAGQLYRIATVRSTTGETPFLSANDRSRWCTILALVATGSYHIDDIVQMRDPQTNRRTWYTIDMVQHRAADGKQHFYSSKPPLLPTLYAGVYWLVRGVTGWTLTTHTFPVARIILTVVNLLPMAGLWWLMWTWVKQLRLSPTMAILAMMLATFGTFLSTFTSTLNNHLPAAIGMAVSLTCLYRIVVMEDRRPWVFVVAGLSTSFTAANELPAMAWLVVIAACLLWFDTWRTVRFHLPAMLPIAMAFFITNYWAHGTWRPAYSQRAVGPLICSVQCTVPEDMTQLEIAPIVDQLAKAGYQLSPAAIVQPSRRVGVWQLWDEQSQWRLALQASKDRRSVSLHQWGDWYDYPGTYWTDEKKQGVDRGEPNPWLYAFHCILGHHGILSLTPFWIVSIIGARAVVVRAGQGSRQSQERIVMLTIAVTAAIVIAFYLLRPLEDRNYGGVSCGLRWAFWLIPGWFWLALRGLPADRPSRWTLVGVGLLVAVSLFSANYPCANPWTTPWLSRLF